jgi:ribosome-binding factor A
MVQSKAPSQRQLRVAEEIRHVLGKMFLEDNLFIAELKTAYTMITDVTISPDLSYATVFIRSMKPANTQEQVDILNKNKGKFRYKIGKSIRLRIVPDIIFKPDVHFEESKAMDDLLNHPKVQADVKKHAQD